ncbi:MAG: hypothetical protein M0D57_07575 [Sphingobacteriales bacterium JAD_PAG50586_3]|nr:MAG: hypothetical protein M0D57_07575 [Sphingobacteriales bacterium JAD_PAG50586_3]
MIFNPVNLKDELAHISKSSPVTTNLIDDVNQWLKAQVADEQKALQNFPNHSGIDFEPVNKGLQFDVNEVYGKQHIKELCIRFRLRFLPSELYKGTLPYSAIKAVNEFENTFAQGAKTHYYIVAPAEFLSCKIAFQTPYYLRS